MAGKKSKAVVKRVICKGNANNKCIRVFIFNNDDNNILSTVQIMELNIGRTCHSVHEQLDDYPTLQLNRASGARDLDNSKRDKFLPDRGNAVRGPGTID